MAVSKPLDKQFSQSRNIFMYPNHRRSYKKYVEKICEYAAHNCWFQVTTTLSTFFHTSFGKISAKCEGGVGLKYLWGDALTDSQDCLGPNDTPYPS